MGVNSLIGRRGKHSDWTWGKRVGLDEEINSRIRIGGKHSD